MHGIKTRFIQTCVFAINVKFVDILFVQNTFKGNALFFNNLVCYDLTWFLTSMLHSELYLVLYKPHFYGC